MNTPLPRDPWRKSSLTIHSHPPLPYLLSFPGLQAWSVVWVIGQHWAGRLPTCSKTIIPASSSIFSLPGGLFSSHADHSWGLGSAVVTRLRSQLWLCMAAARLGADDCPSILSFLICDTQVVTVLSIDMVWDPIRWSDAAKNSKTHCSLAFGLGVCSSFLKDTEGGGNAAYTQWNFLKVLETFLPLTQVPASQQLPFLSLQMLPNMGIILCRRSSLLTTSFCIFAIFFNKHSSPRSILCREIIYNFNISCFCYKFKALNFAKILKLISL